MRKMQLVVVSCILEFIVEKSTAKNEIHVSQRFYKNTPMHLKKECSNPCVLVILKMYGLSKIRILRSAISETLRDRKSIKWKKSWAVRGWREWSIQVAGHVCGLRDTAEKRIFPDAFLDVVWEDIEKQKASCLWYVFSTKTNELRYQVHTSFLYKFKDLLSA